MNLLLQDPFQVLKEYPERLIHTINGPVKTTTIAFSHNGDYLATGCLDGTIIIYDMDTMKPATVLSAHVRAIQWLQWSPHGDRLLSSSRDMTVKIWDLNSIGKNIDIVTPSHDLAFNGPVWGAHWINDGLVAVNILEESFAMLIDLNTERKRFLKIDDADADDVAMDQGYGLNCELYPLAQYGTIIITGSSKGWINFFKIENFDNYEHLYGTRVCSSNIKHLLISQNGERLVVNCSDRSIKQYHLNMQPIELTLEHKYQDVINRLQWNDIKFSNHNAEYLVASPHGSSTHELYLWETRSGSLVRVLEGAEEELMAIDWDFKNMRIASTGLETGDIYLWSLVIQPKWSALAPDFEEIEENIDYQEKEDEFDDEDQDVDENENKISSTKEEDTPIDLTTMDPCDVRGNEQVTSFILPTDYQSILMVQRL
ncbi:similar to Saccharomyces cerevisiae YAR003W SWD1 Subunit of the COMPASS (Set1C) complex, which methylates histone H3 on lysine 4 and is required in transcriptional silencing near telomeres [Maudiozyma barnettii]|uniref:Similar to Saccharomyces cerevisiae YAR003W SWD1 Subunit of the COMPASS (Set1C) complex, which methylates histone H3 on lysine 4 and is required in transcriptional silencing near telomeres n=1 Tax=Maudiozyma barnettii TaxID=61262 RepID=A0A8H2ZIJ1_9SACH|nr:COMPASS subunit protein SWD1 [Kazachstania barnettii]CAB4255968.1 similar to Saccharomyces cerevisiae YAR003W SWD1 Subunit of the COMPASS (Set1C) complex, which methylates histone H3 on lysine 4 and is required in transcriptional silencing near telomeres [Kazachstania barnettii]CAD1784575.1 similar to Saccharomyces cerevisiae YAR003W SWD1 Subunit of the COMPASS (Set1C) complex, which methylates histone H3 on lysine 4 and is required in transcriptional silencing near telomeres [Kazachstania bar